VSRAEAVKLRHLLCHVTAGRVAVVVLGIGVFLRVYDFLLLRSLWLDEAMLARNIVDRSVGELFRPLDHEQGAPVGFLLLQKLIASACGYEDWAFRLLPTALGVWALILFAGLSKHLLGPAAAVRVLPLFAFSAFLVVATDKQYPVDVWAFLALATLGWRAADPTVTGRAFAAFAAAGAVLVWLSHPAPLFGAAVGSAVILSHARAGRWKRAAAASAAAGCWLASFAAVYLISLRHLQASEYMTFYWRFGLAPAGGGPVAFLRWAGEALHVSFVNPGRFEKLDALAIGLAVVGAIRLGRDPLRFGLTVLPVAVVFAAACARLFPFQGRLILFLVPCYLWLVGAGLDALFGSRHRLVRGFAGAAVAGLLWCAFQDARRLVLYPDRWEEPREVMRFMADHAVEKDAVFVHPNARHTYEFYKDRLGLGRLPYLHGNCVPTPLAMQQVRDYPRDCRIWVVYSEITNAAFPVVPMTGDEVCAAAASAGRVELTRCAAPGVWVVLYDRASVRD
jgi:hypothetical protein